LFSILYVRINYSQNKVIWILSLENRKYSNIEHYNGKIYVDFIGSKNDIPLYNDNKSIVYLDTGTDIFLKVHLNSTSCYGQEIECMNIYDICNEYEYLFIAYPYRKKDTYFRNLINQQKEYLKQQEIEFRKFQKHQERKQKKLLQEKQEAEYEKELIRKRLEEYSQKYNLPNTQLISKLLDIIKYNYSQILASSTKPSSDLQYIKKYYTYITFPINHDLNKMILYIIKQEEYLQCF